MEALENARTMEITGQSRAAALAACASHVDEWGLAMPLGMALVWDFGLGDFDRIGLIEYWIANETASGYCSKYLFVFDGQSCPLHSHHYKHETFFVVKGKVCVTLDGEERILNAGDVLPVSQGIVHGFTAMGAALLLETSTVCDPTDNRFVDPAIVQWHAMGIRRLASEALTKK